MSFKIGDVVRMVWEVDGVAMRVSGIISGPTFFGSYDYRIHYDMNELDKYAYAHELTLVEDPAEIHIIKLRLSGNYYAS